MSSSDSSAKANAGSIGDNVTIQETKIAPLAGALAAEKGSHGSDGTYKGDVGDTTGARTESTAPGLNDVTLDGAKIEPLAQDGKQ